VKKLGHILLSLIFLPACIAPPAVERPTPTPVPSGTPIATRTAVPTVTATPQVPSARGDFGFRVINRFPHDRQAFTQGLVYHNGRFFESTGLNGSSSLREVAIETGAVLRKVDIAPEYFAEGLALVGDRLLQLTWTTQVGFVYDKSTFTQIGTWTYPTEGWGLAYNGAQLAMSDGSATIRFLNPETLAVTREITVQANGQPIVRLNELEWMDGVLLANVWQTDQIARINPGTGEVLGWIDMTGLLPEADRPGADVLNGIAYDPATKRLFVTGKLWPTMFEVALVAR
jgi:glutaminyl-peptide cyclotransferase